MVVAVIGYLMVTGMRDSRVSYHTPAELMTRVAADPGYQDVGVRVGGRVVPGTADFNTRTLDLKFQLVDIEQDGVSFPVAFQGPLPQTFTEGMDVIVVGRF